MHRGDRLKAAIVTFAFMMLLLFSPAGATLDRLTSGLGENAGWVWACLGLVVFWATYFVFRTLRLRRERSDDMPSDRAPD
jgi:hypothetical protein